jgi:ATP-dependent RNA helicase DDX10/DBP4
LWGLPQDSTHGIAGHYKSSKNWFEDASSGDDEVATHAKGRQKKRMRSEEVDEPQTLQDLETMAAGLLAP